MAKLNYLLKSTLVSVLLLGGVGCTSENKEVVEENQIDYSGTYIGYSWKGEAEGVEKAVCTEYIETKVTLSKEGIIQSVEMDFMVYKNNEWISRLNPEYSAVIDFSVEPTTATLASDNSEYKAGNSMFKISNNDKMSNYVVGVNEDGIVAFGLVDPFTRYLQEYKLDTYFDYSTPIGDMTIENGGMVPTTRTSTSAMIKPTTWDEYANTSIFDFYAINDSIVGSGVFEGLTSDSTMQEYLERVGVEFIDGKPQPKEVSVGYFGRGGWSGNYEAIEEYLVGKSALEYNSLIDWTNEMYGAGINENNIFGKDVEAGATKTVQNSIDGISGATVRISRESTSFQRAMVEAKIIEEKDVIIGRF